MLWSALVLLLVLLAIYISVGRLLTANLQRWQVEILQLLNTNGPLVVDAEQVSGQWRGFAPEIILSDLRLGFPLSDDKALELSEGRVTVDVVNSLRTGALQLSHVVFVDLSLYGDLGADGSLSLRGLDEEAAQSRGLIREFLLNLKKITLRNNTLLLRTPGGGSRRLGLDLRLSREGSQRHLEARLTSARGTVISLRGEGMGDPTRPDSFTGELYANIRATELGAARDFFSTQPLSAWADGRLQLQAWLGWDAGTPSLELQLEGRDWLISPANETWEVPLQRVALQANVARSGTRWTLSLSDFMLEQGDASITLPVTRLGLDGNAVNLLTRDVELADVGAMMSALETMPARWRDIAAALDARGRLPALEITLDDIGDALNTWHARANFEDLEIESHRGAPGSQGMSGYVELSPGKGVVMLDSTNPRLEFPAVFERPLTFDNLSGSLSVDWNAERLRLDSGILTTQGEEGRARVLLGLEIPFLASQAGIEMDLLVGLQNAHPAHRFKYTPYLLNESLRDWLRDSIGDGVIEQGAFLWRGSLAKQASHLRTVQLAFNVSDMDLAYHSRWPPVTVQEGVVLINDTDVSVWSERAALYDSRVEKLSVETWLGEQGQIMLALQGRMSGPAQDALHVLNNSPLSDVIGSAFADWRAAGRLDTHLEMRLNLSDVSVSPEVEVATRWRNVDLTMMPGNLVIHDVTGQFDYSTARGFFGRELQGFLWGQRVAAQFRQQHPEPTGRYDPASSVLSIDFETTADMTAVRDWLQLGILAFADGQTPARASLRLTPGERPLLSLESDLQGVQLDLPPPWFKARQESRSLQMALPLGAGLMPLSLSLGNDLQLLLPIGEGNLAGGAMSIDAPLPAVELDTLQVVGHTSLVDVDAWLAFIDRYIGVASSARSSVGSAVQTERAGLPASPNRQDTAAVTDSDEGLPFALMIKDLHADRLVFRGQSLEDVTSNLILKDSFWRLSLDNPWLRMAVTLPRLPGPYILDIDYLDLAGVPQTAGYGSEGIGQLQLPVMDVTVANLHFGDIRLGDLALDLSTEGELIVADAITGDLAGTRLSPQSGGRLQWQPGEGGYTSFQASFRFGDLGDILEQFGYQRIVETDSGAVELGLRWPGPPWDFSVGAGEGSMRVDIQSGSFLEVPSGAQGALRVVSILNLADIVQRLSLAQMFESGIPFDSVKGEIYLHRGTVEVPLMEVAGSSRFQFSGLSDINARNLTGELVATLPVANNLPWIAALAANIPVAAGVYVVSKLFNQQMNRLSSAVYTIGGTWENPVVEFDRIFGDSVVGEPVDDVATLIVFEPEARTLPAAITDPITVPQEINSAPAPVP